MHPRHARTVVSQWYKGVTRNHVGCQKSLQVFGFDTETCQGVPYALGVTNDEWYGQSYGPLTNHLTWLLRTLHRRRDKRSTCLLVAHNQSFDWSVLLWPLLKKELRGMEKRKWKRSPKRTSTYVKQVGATVEMFWGRPCFGKIIFDDDPKRPIHLIDTYAFFHMSLKTALESIQSDIQKLDAPFEDDSKIVPLKTLGPYLRNDTLGVWRLGQEIASWHQEYDVRVCVSAPQLAGRIFRHKFLTKNFRYPPWPIRWWSLLSYHGGKVRMTAEPGIYTNCYELDINSAYPEAMRQLPDFASGNWEVIRRFRGNLHGIYRVTGKTRACKWGIVHSHDFKILSGEIKDVWITGYELKEALDSGELSLQSVFGVVWKPTKKARKNPFTEYVDHFWALKEAAPNKGQRDFYKLMLNSLYGKFCARSWEEDDEGNQYRKAGSMFHPFIGTLITGFVNAKIHRLEHKYNALHTATDSVKTLQEPEPEDMGAELGKLKEEIFGDCMILRGKLYVHWRAGWDGKDEKNRLKCGLHGYQGTPDELITMIRTRNCLYQKLRMSRWGESWTRNLQVGAGMPRDLMLHLPRSTIEKCANQLNLL